MAYGSMAPGLPQMAVPAMQQQNPQTQGLAVLQAALKQAGSGTGKPLFGTGGVGMDILNGGMGNGLLAKLFPQKPGTPPAGPIDPNTGMPVTQDVLAGAAASPMPDMGGPGPAPTALTGLW